YVGLLLDVVSCHYSLATLNYTLSLHDALPILIVGTRLRCYAQIVEVAEIGSGWHQVVTRFTVESEGGEKPVCVADGVGRVLVEEDRKSTRLNSSHVSISYAVFCLKKKLAIYRS